MSLLSLIGRLSLNTDGFESGLKKAGSSASEFANTMHAKIGGAVAAAFSVAAVEQMMERVKDHALQIKDLSRQYSITTDEVQKLEKASGKIGLGFDSVASAISRIQKARALAAAGGSAGDSAFEIFARSGIDRSTVLNTGKFSAVDIMAKMGPAAANFDLLGRNAIVVRNVMVELAKLGPVKLISEDQINKIERAEKELKRLRKQIDVDIGLPAATGTAAANINFLQTMKAWQAMPGATFKTVMLPIMTALASAKYVEGLVTGKADTLPPEEEKKKNPSPLVGPTSFALEQGKVIRNSVGTYIGQQAGNSLTSIGGYFFGANTNSEIAKNTKETASAVQEIKKDVSAFRSAMGAEAP